MDNFGGIGHSMTVANKYFKLYLRDALAPYGLNASEGMVLLMLHSAAQHRPAAADRASGSRTQDELISLIHCDKGVMTRTMKQLEDKGLVERLKNPVDSRSYLFNLSESGQALCPLIVAIMHRWNEALLAGIAPHDLAVVEQALATMLTNALSYYQASNGANKNTKKGEN